MSSLPSSPDLLVHGLIEELYRRRGVLGAITAMGLLLGATAIGIRVWAPASVPQAGIDLAEFEPVTVSDPVVQESGSIGVSELWSTSNSASGGQVWVSSDQPG